MSTAKGQGLPGLRLASARALVVAALLAFTSSAVCRAQAIGSHRGDTAGTGGTRSIQGRIFSPTGQLPETRIRVTLDSSNSGSRSVVADADGTFNFNGLESGPYSVTVDAGKEFEVGRETVYVEGSKPTYNVMVYLRLKPGAHPAFAGVPKPAVDLYMQAQESARKGDSKKAVEQLNAALAAHPQFALAQSELGVHLMRTGQVDRAVESLRAALKLAPEDFNTRLNLGLALMEKKEYGEAEKQFREVV
ncbi:MAG TPA: tetratricopeptide repeat protein, partial [Pyrinomonadaceae bacterium]|nr:tetratricopeptide repeat protein [Pyrinomonadaceae bacterium]